MRKIVCALIIMIALSGCEKSQPEFLNLYEFNKLEQEVDMLKAKLKAEKNQYELKINTLKNKINNCSDSLYKLSVKSSGPNFYKVPNGVALPTVKVKEFYPLSSPLKLVIIGKSYHELSFKAEEWDCRGSRCEFKRDSNTILRVKILDIAKIEAIIRKERDSAIYYKVYLANGLHFYATGFNIVGQTESVLHFNYKTADNKLHTIHYSFLSSPQYRESWVKKMITKLEFNKGRLKITMINGDEFTSKDWYVYTNLFDNYDYQKSNKFTSFRDNVTINIPINEITSIVSDEPKESNVETSSFKIKTKYGKEYSSRINPTRWAGKLYIQGINVTIVSDLNRIKSFKPKKNGGDLTFHNQYSLFFRTNK